MTAEAFYRLSETERGFWVAKWQVDKTECQHCGNPREECSDTERVWYPQQTICYATMERAAARARYERLHQDEPWHDGRFKNWSPKPSVDTPYHYMHGVTIWVTRQDLGLGGDFLAPAGQDGRESDSDEATPTEADTSTGV
jgi:hypothetical protein